MQTVLDHASREILQERINQLDENCHALWGTMTVDQMIMHCMLWEEMVLLNKKYKRPLIGRLIGPLILKQVLKDDSPMKRNSPTIPELKTPEARGSLEVQKSKWIWLINEYGSYNAADNTFIHPFFGKMTRQQIGYMAYKHIDHHIRQFGK